MRLRRLFAVAVLFAVAHLFSQPAAFARADDAIEAGRPMKVPHVVFLTGDEEYRSEESMPMLAAILERNFGFRVTICYSLAEDGTIDPENVGSVSGMSALEDADLMVMFLRFRDLPHEQFKHFLAYVESGRPIVGFRTSTHAFRFRDEQSPHRAWNGPKIRQLLGQQWITHHGHFGDGKEFLTEVEAVEDLEHPILRGVKDFKAFSWLYHVQGGGDELAEGSQPLLTGRALKSNHAAHGRQGRYPLKQPVAWVKSYSAASGQSGRVFFTTLGHPFDFKDPNMRRLSVQGILWALGMEQRIPDDGADVQFVTPYEPNNSGFGKKFKPNLRPE